MSEIVEKDGSTDYDTVSMRSQSEIYEDSNLNKSALGLFKQTLNSKNCSYWDSMYVMMALFKMKSFLQCVELVEQSATLSDMRKLIELYPRHPLRDRVVMLDLLKGLFLVETFQPNY